MGSISYAPIPCVKHSNLKHLDRDDHPHYKHPIETIEKDRMGTVISELIDITPANMAVVQPELAEKWRITVYPAAKIYLGIINSSSQLLSLEYTHSLDLLKLSLYVDDKNGLLLYNQTTNTVNVYISGVKLA